MTMSLNEALKNFRQTWNFNATRSMIKHISFVQGSGPQTEIEKTATDLPNRGSSFAGDTSWESIPLDSLESSTSEILISYGWGNEYSPLNIKFGDFSDWCHKWNFSPKVIEAIAPFYVDLPNFFEYHIEESMSRPNGDSDPRILHLAFKLDLKRNFYVMCICRYDIQKQQLKALLFDCGIMGEQKYGHPKPASYDETFQDRMEALRNEPLRLVPMILMQFKHHLLKNFSVFCKQLYSTEGMIGVTKRTPWLHKRGYTLRSDDYDDINAKLYKNQIDYGRLIARCSSLDLFTRHFHDISDQIQQRSTMFSESGRRDSIYNQRFEFENLTRGMDLVKLELEYAQKRLDSQFQILHILISQRDTGLQITLAEAAIRDSAKMKAISILTLVFLPSTFVSAVFSTTIFDFQQWKHQNNQVQGVVSAGWWIYALCCALLTLSMSGIWYLWSWRESRASVRRSKKNLDDERRTSRNGSELELAWDTEEPEE